MELERLEERYAKLLPYLNERQRRLVVAADVEWLGPGSLPRVAQASGLSRPTLYRGKREWEGVEGTDCPPDRIRREGGGRKRRSEEDPALCQSLEALVSPLSRGDPESPLRWTCKSTRQLARALQAEGHRVSHQTVAELLKGLGYSLQANQKTKEGEDHPDRDAQFQYINDQAQEHLAEDSPVISVDTKKKELVGEYKNPGREWRPKGSPQPVQTHDFPDEEVPKAIPYGVYDRGRNTGWVNVGTDHDTASFAVESIRRWWKEMGEACYPSVKRLLICADAGGSNGYRRKLWKVELQRFSDETGLWVTVCHYPTGTSKWNAIEHRLFSFISMNWRGEPLVSHQTVVDLIRSTRTEAGLEVRAQLDTGRYPKGIQVSDDQMRQLRLQGHSFHPDWNYTLTPLVLPSPML
jgi:transposase